MPLQLLTSESTAMSLLETQLEEGFTAGAESPPGNTVVQKLEKYDEPMVVQDQDRTIELKPAVKSPFKMLIAAVMKAVQPWVAPTLQNSWSNLDTGTFTAAGYYRDFMGTLRLRGLVAGGTVGTAIFTLPVGYRPTKTHIFATISNDLLGQVRIGADGVVTAQAGSNAWFSLDGISFRAEQ